MDSLTLLYDCKTKVLQRFFIAKNNKRKHRFLHVPHKSPYSIYTTDIRPGFVDTAMAKGEGLFWVTPVDKAVKQIKKAISKKKKVAFISQRWRYVTILFRLLPSAIYCRM